MNDIWSGALYGLGIMLVIGVLGWLYSLRRHNVNIVDSLWSLMFLAGAICYAVIAGNFSSASVLLLILVAAWALRLSIFLAVRNYGMEEDRRYQEIRANNEPNFSLKSLYIVFGLQVLKLAPLTLRPPESGFWASSLSQRPISSCTGSSPTLRTRARCSIRGSGPTAVIRTISASS